MRRVIANSEAIFLPVLIHLLSLVFRPEWCSFPAQPLYALTIRLFFPGLSYCSLSVRPGIDAMNVDQLSGIHEPEGRGQLGDSLFLTG